MAPGEQDRLIKDMCEIYNFQVGKQAKRTKKTLHGSKNWSTHFSDYQEAIDRVYCNARYLPLQKVSCIRYRVEDIEYC